MNETTHERIVAFSLIYMLTEGDDEERHAFNDLKAKYGESLFSLVQDTARVDSYQNLSLYADYCGKEGGNIVQSGSYNVTSLNHFVDGFGVESPWQGQGGAKGYCALNAPEGSVEDQHFCDSMKEYNVQVDDGHSSVLLWVRPWWVEQTSYKNNWDVDAGSTEFVPSSVIGALHYHHLLQSQDNPMDVSHVGYNVQGCDAAQQVGENLLIRGITYLAPVLHMVADACVPHHVRGALGCGHQAWENAVQLNDITLYKPELVRSLILELTNLNPYVQIAGKDPIAIPGRFNAEMLIYYVARTTIRRIWSSTGLDRTQLASQNATFWKQYVANTDTNNTEGSDIEYLYNLAVAASVVVIKRAYRDLVALKIVQPTFDRVLLPNEEWLSLLQSRVKTEPHLRKTMAPLFGNTTTLSAGMNKLLTELDQAIAEDGSTDTEADRKALDKSEEYLFHRFLKGMEEHGTRFCPLNIDFQKTFPWIRPLYGLATYRPPTRSELSDRTQFRKYVEGEEQHAWKAHLLMSCFFLAAIRYEIARAGKVYRVPNPVFAAGMEKLRQHREKCLVARKIVPLKDWRPVHPLKILAQQG